MEDKECVRMKGSIVILRISEHDIIILGFFIDGKLTDGGICSLIWKVREVSVYTDSWGEVSEICINLKGGKCNLPKNKK